MSTATHTIASFVPRVVRQRLDVLTLHEGTEHSFDLSGAVLFADIAGFTGVVERFGEQGAFGTETLGRLLNQHFSAVNAIVHRHGGDIFNYVGDAVLVIWPNALLGCNASAQAATTAASEIANLITEVAGVSLHMRVAIAMGTMRGMILGGHQAKWTWIASGEPVDFVTHQYHEINPGDVIVDRSMADWLGAAHLAVLLAGGAARLDLSKAVQITELDETVHMDETEQHEVPAEIWESLVPTAAVHQVLQGGNGDWFGEFRQSAQLFVRVPKLALDTPLLDIQRLYMAIQKAVLTTDGTPVDAFFTQEGLLVFAAYGLPPLAHDDDALRAVQAAFLVQDSIRKLHRDLDIGISVGRTYSGVIGDSKRQNLSVLGFNVVLAARLMEHSDGRILVTDDLQKRTANAIEFEARAAIRVKGCDELVRVATPVHMHSVINILPPSNYLVGRDNEIARFREICEQVRFRDLGTALLLKGEPGVGKTRLLMGFRRIAATSDSQLIFVSGARMEKLSSFRVWRLIVREMLKIAIDHGLILYTANSELSDALRVLDDFAYQRNRGVFGGAEQREDDAVRMIEQAVLALVMRLTRVRPILIFIDEGHWMDTVSWRLSEVVCRICPRLLLVCVFRPLESEERGSALCEELERLADLPFGMLLELPPLSREAAMRIARNRLGQAELPTVLENTIWEHSQGNPLFVEEMSALVSTRAKETDDSLSRSAERLFTSVSANLESLITARIDRLDAEHKLTLKVASVIGLVVPADLLGEIHPTGLTRVEMTAQIKELQRTDLFQPGVVDKEVVFKHPLTQHVTYNMITVAVRRQTHRRIALWAVENHNAESVGWNNVVLSHHWERAGEYGRALVVLESCAMDALNNFANTEALIFRERAQACIDKGNLQLPAVTMGHWARIEGQAYCSLGDNPNAKKAFLQGLTLLNMPMPRNNRKMIIGIIQQLSLQFFSRLGLVRPTMTDDQTLVDAVEILLRMARVHYFFGERLSLVYSLLKCVNLAERVTTQIPFMAAHYAAVGAAAGTIPIHSMARGYFNKAASLVNQGAEPWVVCHTMFMQGLYLTSICEWTDATHMFNKGFEITEAQRDYRVWCEMAISYDVVAGVGLFTSKTLPFDQLESMNRRMLERSRQRKDAQIESYAWLAMARSAWLLGDRDVFSESISELNTLLIAEPEKIEPTVKIEAPAFQARLLMCEGAPPLKVFSVLEKAVETLRANPALVKARNAVAYFSLCDTQLDAWERWPTNEWAIVHEQDLNFSMSLFRKFSKRYILAQPFMAFILARNAMRKSHTKIAKVYLRKAVKKAQKYELPWLEARAWLLIAELDSQRADKALSNARSLLAKINVVWPVLDDKPTSRIVVSFP